MVLLHAGRDRNQQPEEMEEVTVEKDALGERLDAVENAIASLGARVDKITGPSSNGDGDCKDSSLPKLQEIATRIDRIEMLLLKAPLPDFKVLDDTIAAFTAKTASMDVRAIAESFPEQGPSTALNISINPEFIDQLCLDDEEVKVTRQPRRRSRNEQQSEHPRCSEGCEMSLESGKWHTCPCCYVLSCSLPCYRNHCKKCAKHFYRQEGQEEPKTPQDQMAPLSQLDAADIQDLENSDEGEDEVLTEVLEHEQLEELAARVKSGDLDLEDLSEEEARKLKAELPELDSNSLSQSWSSWKPWWQQATLDTEASTPSSSSRPSALKPPVHMCCGGGRTAHESVALTTLSAIYAYVHTMRSFNGGWEWAPLEAAPHLLQICPVICSHQVYNSADECLLASLETAKAFRSEGFGDEFDLLCLRDSCTLISGGADYCACALQDIVEIFEACLAGGGRGCSSRLRRGMKKLEFLTSFAFHHFDLLQPLAAMAAKYAEEQQSRLQSTA